MLGFGSKKNNNESTKVFSQKELDACLDIARYITKSYADYIADNSPGEMSVYDVKVLPHPKEIIKKACELFLRYRLDNEDREGLSIKLPLLAQFQEGIGDKPKGADGLSISSSSYAIVEKMQSTIDLENYTEKVRETMIDSELMDKVTNERDAIRGWLKRHLPDTG